MSAEVTGSKMGSPSVSAPEMSSAETATTKVAASASTSTPVGERGGADK
jgi:hypothetical protein